MSLSYREKTVWVSLLVSLILASYFGSQLQALFSVGPAVDATAVSALLLKIVIAFIVVEVVMHALLAMEEQEGADEPEDEREATFRFRANEWGYWCLSIGVIICIINELMNKQLAEGAAISDNPFFQSFGLAPLELKLVIVFWLSEIVRFSAHLYYYRKGE
ncbi:hypothetical protein [Alteromonas ponticola]|uniref:DUF2975 domain-containing protein n=1 Tax=Alteromonas ponticola TaxID=2720613 RepID=A0ABX1R1T0_9ALTE|nr:hypothetical protein [Alteromonas ponticola]NMH60054.1 hypothetical protein [Alteromonas ponticola]